MVKCSCKHCDVAFKFGLADATYDSAVALLVHTRCTVCMARLIVTVALALYRFTVSYPCTDAL